MKLHLGCGTKKMAGWVNIDSVKSVGPDVVHDLTKPFHYADLTVDEVLAEDLLEHFDKYMRFIVFYEWVRVLKINGIITLQVPNFKKLLWRYFKLGYTNFVDMVFGENMWNSKMYIGHFGNHKWGYSVESLQEFVRIFGIEPMTVETVGLNIRLVGKKMNHVTWDILDNVEVYAHANAFGGLPRLRLKDIRVKIQEYQDNLGQI